MSKSAFALSAALCLAASALVGQSNVSIRATVPFEFVAGQSTFPAGEYVVLPLQNVLQIRSGDGRHAVMVLSNSALAAHAPQVSTMVFRVYGDQYFLSQIWIPGNVYGKEVPKSHAERELIAAHRSSKVVAVAATLR